MQRGGYPHHGQFPPDLCTISYISISRSLRPVRLGSGVVRKFLFSPSRGRGRGRRRCQWTCVSARFEREERNSHRAPNPSQGVKVAVTYPNADGTEYLGNVMKVHSNGFCAVTYEDGTKETWVRRGNMRVVSRKEEKEGKVGTVKTGRFEKMAAQDDSWVLPIGCRVKVPVIDNFLMVVRNPHVVLLLLPLLLFF